MSAAALPHAEPPDPVRAFRLTCIFLTMGDRPDDLARAIRSVRAQVGDPIHVVIVCNGVSAPDLPEGVETVELPDNLGIPGGRNAGLESARKAGAEAVLFIDDDGWLPSNDTAARVRELFTAEPELGIVSFRIADPDTEVTQRRHVPRLRVGDPRHSSEVTTFLGGACAIRTELLDHVGALPEEFFYGHEETDLAWRALDAGWRIRYDAACVLSHPTTSPARHPTYFRLNARNRVWLARRNLPAPLAAAYALTWIVVSLARFRRGGRRAWWKGFCEGVREPCGPRRPMRWRTVWRMTRLGRPPLI